MDRYLTIYLDQTTVLVDSSTSPATVILRLPDDAIVNPAGLTMLVKAANSAPPARPSRAVTRSGNPPRKGLRRDVLAALDQIGPATAHDIGTLIDHPMDATSACLSQCNANGWVEWVESVRGPAGVDVRQYQITATGRQALAAHQAGGA
jgi:hypothetical protein